VPHHLEQLLNGRRVAETGAGILLGDHYPYGRVTAPELRQALDAVLHDSHYRQNAARMGQTLKDAGGYLQAVAEIEAYAARDRFLSQSENATPSLLMETK
jgi:UDP:flavonoid glycosyltransferase YjiC (YdhE family)